VLTRRDLARELIRRKRCQDSIHSFALNVQIPTVPGDPLCPDEDLLGPADAFMAKHHAMILDVIQRTIMRPMGRAIIMAPPGSAKSLYTVLGVAWAMGKFPGHRYIYTSYADSLAETQSRRCQLLVQQEHYRRIWLDSPTLNKEAVGQWDLSNGSEFLAAGLTSGVTGHRANGWVMDDPLKGRQEADSETTRQKIYNAYKDDLLTRCLPNAWGILILTRWHEDDPAGRILPADYAGESGMIRGTDGLNWEVLNIQAKCERKDDPLGRKLGEYIWPEFYPPEHWAMFEQAKGAEAARTWASLYQQRPTAQGAGRFHESMFHFYQEGEQPPDLAYVGASDHAVTKNGNDFSEAAVFGVDSRGDLWERDWWSGQEDAGTVANQVLDMAKKWGTSMWFNEGGVIDKAMGPLFNVLRNERQRLGDPVYVDIRALTNMQDKVAKCASFQGRAAAGGETSAGSGVWNHGKIHFRDNANSRRVVQQLCALPAGRYDDAADVCGLIGRAIDQYPVVYVPRDKIPKNLVFGTVEWLEYQEKPERKVRWR
jgi:hypothetical protein